MKSFTLTMNDGAYRELSQLAVASGYDEAAIFAGSIALFELALQAELRGQCLAIVNADDSIDTSYSGFIKGKKQT